MSLLLTFVALIPIAIASYLVFDRLVRLEYEAYRPHWEQDGRPRGLFWTAPGAGPQAAPVFAWLFRSPPWVQADPQARRLLWVLRVLVLVWNVAVLVLLIIPLILSAAGGA